MGILDSFERGIERAVNGAFAKTFKSGLQPVEIAAALRREMDTKAAVVARDRILVPSGFEVDLAPGDFDRMVAFGQSLISELTALVKQHAIAQNYSLAGEIVIEFERDESLTQGMIRVLSNRVQKAVVAWNPVVDIAGVRHTLTRARTVIGRGSEADITIADTGISRRHVEILWDGKHAQVNDLGSTNGSKLDGKAVTKAPLEPGAVIDIGRTRILFQLIAAPASSATDSEVQAK